MHKVDVGLAIQTLMVAVQDHEREAERMERDASEKRAGLEDFARRHRECAASCQDGVDILMNIHKGNLEAKATGLPGDE